MVIKVVLGGYHRNFFEVKVKTFNLIGGRRYLVVRSGLNVRIYSKLIFRAAIYMYPCPNHTDDGIHLGHGQGVSQDLKSGGLF